MPYATQQDILDRYGNDALEIAVDRDNDGQADINAVDRALNDATEEMNVYLGKVKVLPLTSVPPVLVSLCVDIALYKMSIGLAESEQKRQRYEDAVMLLRSIARGDVSLGLSDGSEEPEANGEVELIGPGRQFSRNSMNGLT